MTAAMRFAVPLSILAMLSVSASGTEPRPVLGERWEMRAIPVPLDASDAGHRRVGALTYLGGIALSSSDFAFGGFSSMRITRDRFTLLSDGGNLVSFTMGEDLRPRDVVFGDLPGPETGAFKWQRDSESMTTDPLTGAVWVGFEDRHAIWRYDADFHAQRRIAPAAMVDWPRAGGAESMVRLRSGQFLVISETGRPEGRPESRILLRFAGDPTESAAPETLAYVPPAGYDPTDMAELPDGRLLVLNRRLSLTGLFTARLVLADARGVPAGGVIRGTEIARFERPVLHDNFEALAITREGMDTIVWIASDDNSEFWQQSLLLKFRLETGHAKNPLPAPGTGSR